MRPLVVVPTYNEADNIAEIVSRVRTAVSHAEVLVVDDNSPDGTADLAEEVGTGIGGVHVLRRPEKSGIGNAYRAGFRWGLERGFDAFVEMDADLSHDPDELNSLLSGLDAADLVIGSRYVPGGSIPNWAWHRRLLSDLGNRYAALMLGMRIHDLTSGYRAYASRVLRSLDLDAIRADGYGFQIEMAFRAHRSGHRVIEVPIRFTDRVEGQSKMSGRIIIEALVLVTVWGVRRMFGGYGRLRPVVTVHDIKGNTGRATDYPVLRDGADFVAARPAPGQDGQGADR